MPPTLPPSPWKSIEPIFSSFGLTEEAAEETVEVSEEVELEEELTVVEVLSEALLDLEEPSWQEVDRVTVKSAWNNLKPEGTEL